MADGASVAPESAPQHAPTPGAVHPGPWQQCFQFSFTAGQNELTQTYYVPADRELVIETVDADIGISAGDQAFLFVTTTVRGDRCQHTIVLDELPQMTDVYGATRPVRLYADRNTQVSVMVTRFGNSGYPDIPKPSLVVLSGRLQ